MALRDYLAEEIAHDAADGLLSRREALRRLGMLGLTAAGASALLAACGGDDDDAASATSSSTTSSPAASSTSAPTSAVGDGEVETIRFPGPSGEVQGFWGAPADPVASVLVIHENRGLTPHFHDLVGRFPPEGHAALAVDLLSAEGGTAALGDEGAAQAALGAAPTDRLLGDLRAGIDELMRRVPDRKVGAVGFCFGGGMTWNLLADGEDRLAAAVPFYGPAPADADFSRAKAAVLAIYGALDTRVNGTRDAAIAALERAGLEHDYIEYAGADHAFFNDTGPRYHEEAATAAWAALLAWFDQHLT